MDAALSPSEIDQFIRDGFVRMESAFPTEAAEAARRILWRELPGDADAPATWTEPVVRLGMYTQRPFVEAANTERLLRAYDQLVGPGRWLPCTSMGTFPVRFPSAAVPNDTGWHVDAGFPGAEPADYFGWRVNLRSKGRALLMLFLFSDVGELDAPTRLQVGSHLDVARMLRSAGEAGLSFLELAGRLAGHPAGPEVCATGPAGTVYLCHPFLVHAAQAHRGRTPRFMAQPPLIARDVAYDRDLPLFPVGQAIRQALEP
jgi:hypothetical protein